MPRRRRGRTLPRSGIPPSSSPATTQGQLILGSSQPPLNGPLYGFGELLRPELEGQLVERAGEPERHLIIPVVHRSARIDADVERFIDGHQERDGVRDFFRRDFLAIDFQDAGAALAKAGTVVFEIKCNLVLAGG